jgi:hypothetical protein
VHLVANRQITDEYRPEPSFRPIASRPIANSAFSSGQSPIVNDQFSVHFVDGAGVGRSEYDVRDQTSAFGLFVLTSILRVRFSGSGFFE